MVKRAYGNWRKDSLKNWEVEIKRLAIKLHESGVYVMGVGEKNDIASNHNLLKKAWEAFQDEDGYTNVANAGNYIKRTKPDFDCRTYGVTKLSELLRAYPDRYEVAWSKKYSETLMYKYIEPKKRTGKYKKCPRRGKV